MREKIIALFRRFKSVISFGIVGIINTGTDYLVFSLAHGLLGLTPGQGQVAGYLAGMVSSFVLNRKFTFDSSSQEPARQIISFVAVNAVTLWVSTVMISRLSNLGLNPYIAKIIITGLVMLMNYFGYKLIVFRKSSTQNEEDINDR